VIDEHGDRKDGHKTAHVGRLSGELAGDFSQPTAQQAIGILFAMIGGE
jgi:hypothetical protein